MEKLYTVGFSGAKTMLSRAMSKITWDITDFKKNIKVRWGENLSKMYCKSFI
jgi:hypothetical protein